MTKEQAEAIKAELVDRVERLLAATEPDSLNYRDSRFSKRVSILRRPITLLIRGKGNGDFDIIFYQARHYSGVLARRYQGKVKVAYEDVVRLGVLEILRNHMVLVRRSGSLPWLRTGSVRARKSPLVACYWALNTTLARSSKTG